MMQNDFLAQFKETEHYLFLSKDEKIKHDLDYIAGKMQKEIDDFVIYKRTEFFDILACQHQMLQKKEDNERVIRIQRIMEETKKYLEDQVKELEEQYRAKK